MFFYWSGLGWIPPLLAVGSYFLTTWVGGKLLDNPEGQYITIAHPFLFIIAGIVAALVTIVFSKFLPPSPPPTLEEKRRAIYAHSFIGVPVNRLHWLFLALGVGFYILIVVIK